MKWIGQIIYDQIARFRSDVYLEDSLLTIKSTDTTRTNSGELQFLKDAADTEDNENLGIITFYGENDAGSPENIKFGHIKGAIQDATDGSEGGKISLAVATHDGEIVNGLVINDGDAEDEVDVTIGSGVSSLTTITGKLAMSSGSFADHEGTVQVAPQPIIDHDSLANFVAAEHINWANGSAGTIHPTNIPTLNQNTTGSAATAATVTGATQENITELGTLTNLQVDNINVNGDGITASGDLTITATGNDITLDSDTLSISSSTTQKPLITIEDVTNNADGSRLVFNKNRGAAGQDDDLITALQFKSYNDAGTPEHINYAQIVPKINDASDGVESGQLLFQVQAHGGGNASGLTLTGGSQDNEVDTKIGLGTASVTIVAGTLVMGSTATLDNSGLLQVANQSNITGLGSVTSGTWRANAITHDYIGADAIDGDNIADNAVNSEHYTDGSIDTAHIGDDQVTFAKASGVTPNVFGNVIKLIPSDFMANDDGGNQKFGVGYVESAGSLYGMRTANNATELFAFVSIPEGMTATHVMIYDKNDLAVEVFEAQINATTMVSKGSGNANTIIDITDVASTSKNFLAIQVTTTSATNDKVYGGEITIA